MRIQNFLESALPKFSLISEIINNPIKLMFVSVISLSASVVVNLETANALLIKLFIADALTGIAASYNIWRKKPQKKDKWFFGKGEGFSSEKFRKMFIKLIVYYGTPVLIETFQKTFLLRNIKINILSEAEFTLTTFIILVFCLIEGFSIFHENLPKLGFNLYEQIKKFFGLYRDVKKELKEED